MSVLALVERLAPHIEKELNLVIKSKEEAESLSSKLKKIQAGLQDAEKEGATNTAVKNWLKQLEGVAHEMEDVLDEWEILNLQVEMEGLSLDNVRSFILSLCSCFKQVLGRRENTKKIQALSGRIDQILSEPERNKYNFVSKNNPRIPEFRQEPSTSIVSKLGVYGRDAVKDNLVGELKKEVGEDDTQIVSIVGIGGLGKTTLAQMVYNDVRVKGFFNLKGWVSVSEPFDASVVARSILEAFGENCGDAKNLETLVQRIRKCVQNKRFLLVLDNVWTGERQRWESLKNCLDGGKGSKILVTTRFESVAVMMGTTTRQPLGPLSGSECSEILNGIALRGRRKEEYEKLSCIGVEIAKKCNGLPLAATSLGSMLALKSSEDEWRSVLKSPLWTYDGEVSYVFRILNLSFIELSPILKRCFLSSVMFPRGALISVDEMIRIWMAYGFLNSKASFDGVRSKGLEYFKHLEMRSFLQKVGSDEDDEHVVERYKMHDIMHEFARHMRRNEFSFIINDHVKSVRVKSLRGHKLQSVPKELGELLHLRHLDLSNNLLVELPETVCNLYFLQTLGIENCQYLSRLPEGIEKLVNLRHILNTGSKLLVEYPRGLEKLSGLWTLSEFRWNELGYLGNMNKLQGSLRIYLRNSDDVEQVRKANLGNKSHIKELELISCEEKTVYGTVPEAMQPPPNLQSLHIITTHGKWLSHWIEKSFDNLKLLTFCRIKTYYSHMPPFGTLPALEKLVINCDSLKCLKTRQLLGQNGFPRLKYLCFVDCSWWQEWEDIDDEEAAADFEAMRCLEELEIHNCDELRALPRNLLQQATTLKIIKLSSIRERSSLMRDIDGGGLSYLPNVACAINVMPFRTTSVVASVLRRALGARAAHLTGLRY